MDQQESNQGPRSRVKRRSNLKIYLVAFFIILLSGALLFWYQKDPHLSLTDLFSQKPASDTVASKEKLSDSGKFPHQDSADKQITPQDQPSLITIKEPEVIQDLSKTPEKDGVSPGSVCETECTQIETFYAHLDKQAYIQAYKLPQPSKDYFTNLIIKLSQTPPVVNRETDDLFTILKNTAHFFRIIGKKNIQIIKGILNQEKDSIEEILAGFYSLSSDPECLKTHMGFIIPENALYNYAGFFLNTMGGRLYLFRRDSFSRIPVSYYSILLIDRANREGTNKDGIDIGPAITSLISEIETTGNQLKLKETYLDELYLLKEKYPQESEQGPSGQ